jgi:arylsulfatase A-like enzyme
VLIEIPNAKEPTVWVHYTILISPGTPGLGSYGDAPIDRYDQEIGYTDFYIGRLLDYFRQKGLYENTIIIFTADHGEEFGDHGGRFHYTCFQEVLRVPLIIKAPLLKPAVDNRQAEQIDLFP